MTEPLVLDHVKVGDLLALSLVGAFVPSYIVPVTARPTIKGKTFVQVAVPARDGSQRLLTFRLTGTLAEPSRLWHARPAKPEDHDLLAGHALRSKLKTYLTTATLDELQKLDAFLAAERT